MVEVQSLPSDLLVALGEQLHRFAAPLAALLVPCHPSLRSFQRLFCLAVVAWVLDEGAIRERQKRFQAHINTVRLLGEWQGLYRHIRTGEAGIPAIGFSADGGGLGRAFQGAMQANGDPAYLGQREDAPIQGDAIAVLWIGDAVVAVAPLETRIPRLLTSLDAPEEGLKGFVQSLDDILMEKCICQ